MRSVKHKCKRGSSFTPRLWLGSSLSFLFVQLCVLYLSVRARSWRRFGSGSTVWTEGRRGAKRGRSEGGFGRRGLARQSWPACSQGYQSLVQCGGRRTQLSADQGTSCRCKGLRVLSSTNKAPRCRTLKIKLYSLVVVGAGVGYPYASSGDPVGKESQCRQLWQYGRW